MPFAFLSIEGESHIAIWMHWLHVCIEYPSWFQIPTQNSEFLAIRYRFDFENARARASKPDFTLNIYFPFLLSTSLAFGVFAIQTGFVFAPSGPTTIVRWLLVANTLEALSINYLFDQRVRNVQSCSDPSELISDHILHTSGSLQMWRLISSRPHGYRLQLDPLVYASRWMNTNILLLTQRSRRGAPYVSDAVCCTLLFSKAWYWEYRKEVCSCCQAIAARDWCPRLDSIFSVSNEPIYQQTSLTTLLMFLGYSYLTYFEYAWFRHRERTR